MNEDEGVTGVITPQHMHIHMTKGKEQVVKSCKRTGKAPVCQ